jgi:hypothetical protein
MINRIKHKNKILLILLLIITICCHGQEKITVRKKYLDSVKNQLAIYTISSYSHLNMYDRCDADNRELKLQLTTTQTTLEKVVARKKRNSVLFSVFIIIVAAGSFIMGVTLK